MFKDACALARQFTFPIIVSQRTVSGKCASSIAAFVVVNDEGWIVTAGHVMQQLNDSIAAATKCQDRIRDEAAINADTTLDDKLRRGRLKALGKTKADDLDRISAMWGHFPNNPQVTTSAIMAEADLAIGKLEPFDPSWVSTYPVFKDPSRDFEPGTSLCKMGYPFHQFQPSFDSALETFILPAEAVPVPFFPIEGIFTRIALFRPDPNQPQPAVPSMCVETSTPGLRGQSGGPTFDKKGSIWAIQSRTSSYPLGFNSSIPEQYYHVGLGVHPTTVFGMFDKFGVKYDVSKY